MGKTREPKAACPPIGGAITLQTKERRDADERYISGFNPVLYLDRRPRWSVSSDLQGKEIAATTRTSDG